MGNPWKHDPERMEVEVIKAMVYLGHARDDEDHDAVYQRWEGMFESGDDAYYQVSQEAETEYWQSLIRT